MAEKKRGVPAGLLIGLWDLINFSRRLVFNIIFILLVIAFIAVLRRHAPELRDNTALVLAPKGAIVEQYTDNATQRAVANAVGNRIRQVQLRDILRSIGDAAKDSRITRIVLDPDGIDSAGVSTLREIGAALDRFRQSGKQVIAVSDGMTQGQYYLASHANKILLHPDSMEGVLLTGFASYRTYFKDALDWLGVDVHLFRVGEYKSYAEPYTRNDASPAAKQADRYWMTGLWNDYLQDIARQRHLSVDDLTGLIDNYADAVKAVDGNLAKLALDHKLVDQLVTPDQANDMLIALGARDGHSFRQIDFKDYLAAQGPDLMRQARPEVGVVVAEGEILPGDQPQGTVGGESTVDLLRRARHDPNIKAVVLRVDSPGGDAFSSELIRRQVELIKAAHKPVIVSMGDVAASGGYWISMSGDRIFADPTTITGSIGIFGLFMNVPNTLAKIGMHTDGVATTPLADAIDPRRPLDPKVGQTLQLIIDAGYQDFIGHVAKARNMTKAQVDAIAQGRVWSGRQAKARGLVDQLGGLEDAIHAAAKTANLGKNYRVAYVEKPMSTWQRFVLGMSQDTLARFARSVLPDMPIGLLSQPEIRDQMRLLHSLQSNRLGVYAYCFCNLRN